MTAEESAAKFECHEKQIDIQLWGMKTQEVTI